LLYPLSLYLSMEAANLFKLPTLKLLKPVVINEPRPSVGQQLSTNLSEIATRSVKHNDTKETQNPASIS
jgi:hypothetical protein